MEIGNTLIQKLVVMSFELMSFGFERVGLLI